MTGDQGPVTGKSDQRMVNGEQKAGANNRSYSLQSSASMRWSLARPHSRHRSLVPDHSLFTYRDSRHRHLVMSSLVWQVRRSEVLRTDVTAQSHICFLPASRGCGLRESAEPDRSQKPMVLPGTSQPNALRVYVTALSFLRVIFRQSSASLSRGLETQYGF